MQLTSYDLERLEHRLKGLDVNDEQIAGLFILARVAIRARNRYALTHLWSKQEQRWERIEDDAFVKGVNIP